MLLISMLVSVYNDVHDIVVIEDSNESEDDTMSCILLFQKKIKLAN